MVALRATTAFAMLLSVLALACSKNDSSPGVGTSASSTAPAHVAAIGRERPFEPSALDRDLLARFRALNPEVEAVRVFSIMGTVTPEDSGRYVAVAHGRTRNLPHEDRFTNVAHAEDIFAVFALDHDLTKVNRRLGLFISPRLGDYEARIARITKDSVIVCGRGEMHGDSQKRWAFELDSARSAETARERESFLRNRPPPSEIDASDEGDEAVSPAPDCPGIVAQ